MFRNGILERSFVKMFKRILRSSIPFLKVYCILSLHLLRVVIFPHVDIKLMLVLYTINKLLCLPTLISRYFRGCAEPCDA